MLVNSRQRERALLLFRPGHFPGYLTCWLRGHSVYLLLLSASLTQLFLKAGHLSQAAWGVSPSPLSRVAVSLLVIVASEITKFLVLHG